jgi:hypothetical protein
VGSTNTITPQNASSYIITGSNANGTFSWNLVRSTPPLCFAVLIVEPQEYTMTEQNAYPCLEIFQIAHLLQLNWISYMPHAYVTGHIVFNGPKYMALLPRV